MSVFVVRPAEARGGAHRPGNVSSPVGGGHGPLYPADHHRRSPGTFSTLWEIDYCRRSGIAYYYLGFYVAAGPAMAYKARYHPCEILEDRRHWVNSNP